MQGSLLGRDRGTLNFDASSSHQQKALVLSFFYKSTGKTTTSKIIFRELKNSWVNTFLSPVRQNSLAVDAFDVFFPLVCLGNTLKYGDSTGFRYPWERCTRILSSTYQNLWLTRVSYHFHSFLGSDWKQLKYPAMLCFAGCFATLCFSYYCIFLQ